MINAMASSLTAVHDEIIARNHLDSGDSDFPFPYTIAYAPLISDISDEGDCNLFSSPTCVIYYHTKNDIPGTFATAFGNIVYEINVVRSRALNLWSSAYSGFTHVDTRPNWLRLAESSRWELSLEVMKEMAAELNTSLIMQNFSALDAGLRNADVSKMGLDAGVCILRVTFAARHQLTRWEEFLDRIDGELRGRGCNSKSIEGIRVASAI